jgi:hypothetical protein
MRLVNESGTAPWFVSISSVALAMLIEIVAFNH